MNETDAKAVYSTTLTPVCAVGASAGGVTALQNFFRLLPDDLGLAYVVIVHLAPDHPSALGQILGACTRMPVLQVEDGPTLRPNHVYVIPPDRELAIDGDSVTARDFSEPRGRRAPIDVFFRSIAAARGDGIAVVLTGAGSDGALGVRAIKGGGGIVLVQEPADAAYPMMPQNAIATGTADFVGPLPLLVERVGEVARSKEAVRSLDADGAANDLRRAIGFLRTRTGHDFSGYKRATVLRRVSRRMQVTRTETLAEYYDLLRATPEEARELFADLLISVTAFFRDRAAFDALEQKAVARLFEGADEEEGIRLWVAGCATGEEAYSVAMLLLEEAERRKAFQPIQIFATDLDEEALATAREGRYPRTIEADLSSERLRRFFVDEGTHYRVRKEVRDLVLFASHSVLKDPPFTRLDLVTCRNLLIYLERALQHQLLAVFHYALRPEGLLFLGSAETADGAAELFVPLDREARLYQAKAKAAQALPLVAHIPLASRLTAASRSLPGTGIDSERLLSTAHAASLESAAPPSALVDEAHNILNLSGTAGPFILHSGGPLSNSLPSVVRPELRLDLKLALDRAFARLPTLTHPVPVRFDGEVRRIALNVRPVVPGDHAVPRALVFFLDGGAVEDSGTSEADGTRSDEVRRLHGELKAAREALVVSRHEHDISVQDLRAANEELQSINEEYRSTAEELETSKEELQSINEELRTVNAELKVKLDDVSVAHSDLQNITASTEIGTLFLDTELRIRLFTPLVTDLINITKHDAGRRITDFTHRLHYDGLEADVLGVLRTLSPLDREVRSRDGRWYVIRVRPYRTVENRIDGAVLSFIDVTARHEAEERLLESERQLRALIDVSFQMVYRMAPDWRRMRELSGGNVLPDAGVPNESWLDRYVPVEDQPSVRAVIRRAIENRSIFDLEHRVRRTDGTIGWTHSRAIPMVDPTTGEIAEWLAIAEDITARRETEAALVESEQRYRVLVEGLPQLIWTAVDDGRWTWSSSQWHAYSGQTERESRGFGWLRAVHPDDRGRVKAAWRSAKDGDFFEAECRIGNVGTKTSRWFQTRATRVIDSDGRAGGWLGTSTDIDDLRRLQERQSILVAELQHRTRNLIAVVRSIARETMATSPDLEGFRARFGERMSALSRIQGLLSRAEDTPITIEALVRAELEALGFDVDGKRIRVRGPDVTLPNRDVQTLALAIHELTTNATKYGALSSAAGNLSVQWRLLDEPSGGERLVLEWLEQGVEPREDPPSVAKGFGRKLILEALPHSMGATTRYDIEDDTVRCDIEVPWEGRGAGRGQA